MDNNEKMENKTMNMKKELSLEEMEQVAGGGFWDKIKQAAEKICDGVKDLFD